MINWLEEAKQRRERLLRAQDAEGLRDGRLRGQVTDTGYSLRIIGVIDSWFGIDVLAVAEDLFELKPQQVNLYIDSPGGDLFDALALRAALDTLVSGGAEIIARAGAVVGSAAIPIFLSGTSRTGHDYSRFMVHNPEAAVFFHGNHISMPRDFENFLGTLKAGTDLYWDSISSSVNSDVVSDWRDSESETWLTSASAVEFGILTSADVVDADPDVDVVATVHPLRRQVIGAAVRSSLFSTFGGISDER